MIPPIARRTGDSVAELDHELDRVRLFDELFEAHGRAVYNFCFRRTADWALAEDLMSIVFLEAWRRRSTPALTGNDSARPWLFGVAINVMRNQRRSLRRYKAALARMSPPALTPDFTAEADQRLDDERQAVRLRDLISVLPQRDQDVIALCIGSEFTYEQAALALGVPVGTVRSRLSRAKVHLLGLTTQSESSKPPAADDASIRKEA